MPIPAIIGAVAAVASTAVAAGTAAAAAKKRSGLISETPEERSMLQLQSEKAADLASMGGMSAGQYQRAQMPEDILAQQNQTMANTMAANPLISAFRKEAFAKMALAKTKVGIMQNQLRIEDVDEQRAAKNAFASAEIADQARRGEALITERKNKIKLQEIAQKQAMWNSFGKLAAATGQVVSASVETAQANAGNMDFDIEGNYQAEGGLGIGFDSELEQPSMLAGVQQLPSTELQGMSESFKMPTGTPSLFDNMYDEGGTLGGKLPMDTSLTQADSMLMNPFNSWDTNPSLETIMNKFDPKNYDSYIF